MYIQMMDTIYSVSHQVVCGRGDYDHIMNNSTKAENDSSSGPENTMCQSKWQQNSNSMRLNTSTSNKLQLHQKLLVRGGDSQEDFAMTMMVTRHTPWPVQALRSGM